MRMFLQARGFDGCTGTTDRPTSSWNCAPDRVPGKTTSKAVRHDDLRSLSLTAVEHGGNVELASALGEEGAV